MKEYYKDIIFTLVPLDGKYKYKDIFQIYPANLEGMPKSLSQRHFPNIIEYRILEEDKVNITNEFKGLESLYIETATTNKKKDNILALLSIFSNNIFFRYKDLTGSWGMPVPDNLEDESNIWESKWCAPFFHFPDMPKQLSINGLSNIEISDIIRLPDNAFYIYEPNLDFDSNKHIVFPLSMDKLFDAYFLLDKDTKSTIDSAVSFALSAVELKNSKKTLSLLASFTALETMVNLEYKNVAAEKCSECNQDKFSIAKKFREYLLKYIANSDKNKKKFNYYYSLRSKIVHTGMHLKTEPLFAEVSLEEEEKEFFDSIEILQISRLSITKWLLKNYDN